MLKKASLMAFLLLIISYGKAESFPISKVKLGDTYFQEYGRYVTYNEEGKVDKAGECSFAFEVDKTPSNSSELILEDYSEGNDINILIKHKDTKKMAINHYGVKDISKISSYNETTHFLGETTAIVTQTKNVSNFSSVRKTLKMTKVRENTISVELITEDFKIYGLSRDVKLCTVSYNKD